MNTQKILPLVCGGFITALSCAPSVAQPLITSFQGNGQLTWTNTAGTNGFTVEWSPAVTGPWSANWHALDSVVSTGAQTSVSVPMFYRVAQRYTTASLRGLWFVVSPGMGNIYFRAEEDGLLSEVGIFNLRSPNGVFSVTAGGTASVSFWVKKGAPIQFSFQIGQQSNPLGTLVRMDDPARCSGTWSGSLSQTAGLGSPASFPVNFTVDSTGGITNFNGFSSPVTGRLYALASGPVAAFLYTAQTGPYNQIQISGTLTGNSLVGTFEADGSDVAGTVSLIRQ